MNTKRDNSVYRKVYEAIRQGKLPPAKRLACSKCGGPAVEYHHQDYDQPLAVTAFCRNCHLSLHHAARLESKQPAVKARLHWNKKRPLSLSLDRRMLRILMAQHKLSAIDLTHATGLRRDEISALLNNKAEPSMETLGILCRVLRCTPNDILTMEMLERELA